MNAFVWIIAIMLGVVALVVLVSALVASFRSRQGAMLCLGAVLTGGFAISALVVRSPYVLAVIAIIAAFVALRVVGRTTRNPSDSRKVMKLSAAHCTLLGGSFIFLIPFAWFISSSLKTDEEQSVFPPVWIPTQQVRSSTLQNGAGLGAGLSWYLKDTTKAMQVAEVADLPSGEIRVQPLEGDGASFVASREQLTKIRQIAPRWENYSEALAFLPPETHYGLTFLGNTLFLTLMTVVGTILSSSLVAYAFARLQWPGRNLLFVVLLATMMVPAAVTMMPQFLIFRSLGWVDTLLPLWVPAFFGSAFNIFLLRQFFMSIPTELEDAAKIDGCGHFATYWKIMLPQVKPALAAIGILSVMAAWNNFQGPLIYLSSPEKMTLAYALQLYQQQHGGEPGLLMAASTLVVLPIIVLFFFTQRYFIEGVSLSGLGGR